MATKKNEPRKTLRVAERSWARYVAHWNAEASRFGLPLIPEGPISLKGLYAGKFLSEAEVLRLQVNCLQDLVDDSYALVRIGFDHSRQQRERASSPRSACLDSLFTELTSTRYADWRNKELWSEATTIGERLDLSIAERKGKLEWEHRDTGKSGALAFDSFQVKLAIFRQLHGTQKRPRRSKKKVSRARPR
jgi:hypothetical protein